MPSHSPSKGSNIHTSRNACGRDTEDELAKVADERDDAKKEREEVKWQARQAEKRAAAAEEELDSVQQVAVCMAP